MNISVLGCGRWGLAIATHLVKKNAVKIWEFFPDKALEMQTTRKSVYLTGAKVAEGINISSDLEDVIKFGAIVIVALPSDKVAVTLEKCQELIQYKPVVLCSKGFTNDGRLLSELAKEYVRGEIYCLYGPTNADEIYNFKFSGAVLAGRSKNQSLEQALEDTEFKIELSDDIIGVQVAAALKNILAIYIGMLSGMGQGENAKAYILTKGIREMMEYGCSLGAKEDTFFSIAGIGDLLTTCYSEKSRNYLFGVQIGKGMSKELILSQMSNIVEGVQTLITVHKVANGNGLELPLFNGLYKIIFEEGDPLSLMRSLN